MPVRFFLVRVRFGGRLLLVVIGGRLFMPVKENPVQPGLLVSFYGFPFIGIIKREGRRCQAIAAFARVVRFLYFL